MLVNQNGGGSQKKGYKIQQKVQKKPASNKMSVEQYVKPVQRMNVEQKVKPVQKSGWGIRDEFPSVAHDMSGTKQQPYSQPETKYLTEEAKRRRNERYAKAYKKAWLTSATKSPSK